ncbi:Nucleolar protein [Dirofilaria immitis]
MKRKGDDTLEEINREREKRRLICMQIDDYIEEIKLSNVEKCKLETLAESVKSAIYAAKEAEVAYQMDDLQELNLGKIRFPFSLPFGLELNNVKSSCGCRWIHPDKIDALGNWRIGHRTKIDPILDLIIIIPQNYFGSRDYLNFAYFVKRAHYICQVARILVDTGFSVKFGLDYFDTLKPLLFVSNKNESESDGFLRIHFAPPRDFTKISRFRPENNNLRPSFCSAHFGSLGIDTPTPVYNSKILIDMLREELEAKHEAFFHEKPAFLKAFIMIRLWMLQRGFIQRIDGFSDLLLASWLMYINMQEILFAQASVFDIIMGFFSSLISTNWKESRVAISLSVTAIEEIRAAATDAITKMNTFSEFDHLFVKNHPFTSAFDQYIRIRLSQSYLENIFQKMCSAECISTCNDLLFIFKRRLIPLLKEALLDRIVNFDFFTPDQQVTLWNVCEEREKSTTNEVALLIGFRLSTKWNNLLTRGPPAKSSDAVHFRQFWGDICELRRFPDNAICEAVVWDSSNVTVLICQHILQRHLKLEASNVEERTLKMEEILPNALDRYSTIARAYDKLSQILHMVQDLPLLITNIHPVSAYLRRTAPFPPLSTNAIIEGHSAFIKDSVAFPLSHISPPYLPTVEVQITMEQSGKWGEELNAIARLKTAFYVELSKILKEKHSLQAIPFDDYLIVHFNTVVFRLIIANPKEVHIMRKLNGGKTGIPKDSPTSKLKELEVILKPQLTALLHSASQRFEAFADTCRLAIYWLSSHALSDYLNEMILETIVAYIFLKPFSVQPPRTPFIGFFHFLTLLSTHNWLMKPLFVDFDNEWTETDIDEIEKEFIKMRPVLPVMVICTPVDRSGYRWTREEPQPLILKRLIALSKASAALIEQHINNLAVLNLKGLFTTDISSFSNVIIHIRGRHKVRRKVVRGKLINGPLPVIDYDPIRVYVKRLRQSFSSVALFFYNKYKGNMIGVAWKPDALLPRDASISKCLHRLKRSDNKLVVNIKAILDDFMILGQGLVREVTQNLAVEDDENMEN